MVPDTNLGDGIIVGILILVLLTLQWLDAHKDAYDNRGRGGRR